MIATLSLALCVPSIELWLVSRQWLPVFSLHPLQSFTSVDCLHERVSNRPQLLIKDLHRCCAQITVAGSLFNSVLETTAATTRPLSEHDPSVHHIQTATPHFASFSLAPYSVALLALHLSSSIRVLATGSSPQASQLMPSILQKCWYLNSTTCRIGVWDKQSSCGSSSLLVHECPALGAHRCCFECLITSAGVSPDCLIKAPLGVPGSTPWAELACYLRRSWRLSHLPT